MEFNELQLRIIESSGNQELMKTAVKEGKFYVVATPCISGYSIGCFDNGTPAFTATKDESISENRDIIETYQDQIDRKERDNDDEWQGLVLEARWDCMSENMDLYTDGDFLHRESWKSLCGV